MTELWEKQDYETPYAYTAFCVYRDMPTHRRSLRKGANEFYGVEEWNKQRQFMRWSASNKWVERAAAYDLHLDEINRREHEKAIKEMNKRQAKIGAAMQAKGWEGVANNDPTLDEGRRLIETGVRVERIARGESTEVIQSEGTHQVKIINVYKQEREDEDKESED